MRGGPVVRVFWTNVTEDTAVVTIPNKVVDDVNHPGDASVADDQPVPDVEVPATKAFTGLPPMVHATADNLQGVDGSRPAFPTVEDHPHVDVVDLGEWYSGIGHEADLVAVALNAVERPVPHQVGSPPFGHAKRMSAHLARLERAGPLHNGPVLWVYSCRPTQAE